MVAKPQIFWTIKTFDASALPDFAATAYQEVLPYIQDFLCAEHPFREGVVCPFVPSALKHDRIFFTHFPTEDSDEKYGTHIQGCVDFYLARKRAQKGFGALLILFPKDFDIGKLLELHFENKEKCVSQSLMLGALYRTNQAPSLHNKEYYPLRTPTPILVIRDMVVSDLMFLDPRHYSLRKRLVFLEAFLATFADHQGAVAKKEMEEARRLFQYYRNKQRFYFGMKVGLVTIVTLLLIFLFSLFLHS